MTSRRRFRGILPASQVAVSVLFGGWGLWQRNRILSHDYLFGTGWNSTARFHVWPWPFKFAVIENLPAFLAGVLLSWPISAVKPDLPESVQLAPSLLFVLVLWYWIGVQLDRRWDVGQKAPWVSLAVFTAVPIGEEGRIYRGWRIRTWGHHLPIRRKIPRSVERPCHVCHDEENKVCGLPADLEADTAAFQRKPEALTFTVDREYFRRCRDVYPSWYRFSDHFPGIEFFNNSHAVYNTYLHRRVSRRFGKPDLCCQY